MMFPNNVSRKGEIFNYSICGPKCPIPFHISLQWPEGKKSEGSAPLQEQVITKESERIGLSVIFLPEPLFVNVTYSLSEIIKCKNFLVRCLCVWASSSSFFFLSTYAAVVVVIPPFDKFDFQTKVWRSKIRELFSPSVIKLLYILLSYLE